MTLSDQPELILVATKATSTTAAPSWLDSTQARAERTGAVLWELLDAPAPGGPGPGHSHVLSFDTAAWTAWQVERDRARAVDPGAMASHAEIAVDHWASAGEAIRLGDAAPSALIVAEVLCTDPSRHDEWDRWYDDEHLPDMMASNAFEAGHRWTRADVHPGAPNHLTVYEIAGRTVAEAVAQSAAIMPDLVAAGRKHPCHTGGRTMALQRVQ